MQYFAQLKPFKDKDKIESAQTCADICAVKDKRIDNTIVNRQIRQGGYNRIAGQRKQYRQHNTRARERGKAGEGFSLYIYI
jgi:hypothetical protein